VIHFVHDIHRSRLTSDITSKFQSVVMFEIVKILNMNKQEFSGTQKSQA